MCVQRPEQICTSNILKPTFQYILTGTCHSQKFLFCAVDVGIFSHLSLFRLFDYFTEIGVILMLQNFNIIFENGLHVVSPFFLLPFFSFFFSFYFPSSPVFMLSSPLEAVMILLP